MLKSLLKLGSGDRFYSQRVAMQETGKCNEAWSDWLMQGDDAKSVAGSWVCNATKQGTTHLFIFFSHFLIWAVWFGLWLTFSFLLALGPRIGHTYMSMLSLYDLQPEAPLHLLFCCFVTNKVEPIELILSLHVGSNASPQEVIPDYCS